MSEIPPLLSHSLTTIQYSIYESIHEYILGRKCKKVRFQTFLDHHHEMQSHTRVIFASKYNLKYRINDIIKVHQIL